MFIRVLSPGKPALECREQSEHRRGGPFFRGYSSTTADQLSFPSANVSLHPSISACRVGVLRQPSRAAGGYVCTPTYPAFATMTLSAASGVGGTAAGTPDRTQAKMQRLILGACLLAGRGGAFHVPVASSLSRNARLSAGSRLPSTGRPVHSGGVTMAAAAAGEMEETIVGRLTEALSPVHLEVINESHMHSGPAKESHFKVRNQSQYFYAARGLVCSTCAKGGECSKQHPFSCVNSRPRRVGGVDRC